MLFPDQLRELTISSLGADVKSDSWGVREWVMRKRQWYTGASKNSSAGQAWLFCFLFFLYNCTLATQHLPILQGTVQFPDLFCSMLTSLPFWGGEHYWGWNPGVLYQNYIPVSFNFFFILKQDTAKYLTGSISQTSCLRLSSGWDYGHVPLHLAWSLLSQPSSVLSSVSWSNYSILLPTPHEIVFRSTELIIRVYSNN